MNVITIVCCVLTRVEVVSELIGFKDKFQKAAMKQKRKMLRMEYASTLNALSILLMSLKSGNYIQG